jgi:hypothetical protein
MKAPTLMDIRKLWAGVVVVITYTMVVYTIPLWPSLNPYNALKRGETELNTISHRATNMNGPLPDQAEQNAPHKEHPELQEWWR